MYKKITPWIVVLLFVAMIIGPNLHNPKEAHAVKNAVIAEMAKRFAADDYDSRSLSMPMDSLIDFSARGLDTLASFAKLKRYLANNTAITNGRGIGLLNSGGTIALYADTTQTKTHLNDVAIREATPSLTISDTDVETGASVDSSSIVLEADGVPSITLHGADDDDVTITMDTNDEMLFTGSAADYDFDGNIDIASGKVYEINNTQITSDALSDVSSIGMLDETETIAADWTISEATPSLTFKDSDLEADSGKIVIEADGDPSITLYGADGDADAGSIDLDASDGLNFKNFTTVDIEDGTLQVGGSQITSGALSDVSSIAMLDEAEIIAESWTVRTTSPTFTLWDSAAEADSQKVVIEADGEPSITFYGTDGDDDTGSIDIDTDDGLNFKNFTTVDIENGTLQVGGAQISSAALSDESSIAMLDEAEVIAADWVVSETTPTFEIYDSAAEADSQKIAFEADGEPTMTFFGTDGDADTWSIAIDTDDQMVISGASGGVNIDGPVEIAGALTAVLMTEATTGETEAVSAAESGIVYVQTRSSTTVTYTLPEAAAGLTYTFVCGHADSEILINVQTGDAIVTKTHASDDGAALAPAAGTGIKNTAATNVAGDQITLVALDAVTWYGVAQAGVWASQ